MSIMIGIHQQQDKVDQLYANLGIRAAELTAVGPFPNKEEALAWRLTMWQRISNCQIIKMADTEDTSAPWHGFSFEQ